MINPINSTQVENRSGIIPLKDVKNTAFTSAFKNKSQPAVPFGLPYAVNINTSLKTHEEQQMYFELVSAVNNSTQKDLSPEQQQFTQAQKLDILLKNGKLLSSNSNDGTTTLSNLHKILKTPRINNLSNVKIANQVIDALFDPTIITQKFGDVPKEVRDLILLNPETDPEIKQNPQLINVESSGTCVATSIEFHMANKHPAEFARWAEGLTSPDNSINQIVKTGSLSKNFLDVVWLLDAFKMKTPNFNFDTISLNLKPDKNAITRAMIQNDYQDPGERNIVDVLMQSTIMNVGSQKTYNSLTDERKGEFNSNPQGLIEFEKTFVESIIENKEKLSIVYQNVDENQVLKGYRCGFDKIEKHLKDAIDGGEDVIIGYVLTDKDNKIINGHEITVVDIKKGRGGESIFVCNDTDDGKNKFVEYPASYLLPKIHHAGYPAHIVEHETDLIYAA